MTAYRPINIAQINFFKPISGVVTNRYDSNEGHFGVDIVADKEKTIKSVLDGTVLFAQWTLETGHVIAVLHQNNLISVYKHNAVLLKHQGDRVNSGEPIAIVGESGELSTGPHLHFELWRNGSPVNPEDYIIF
jgi:murein DD-endopeptidase MepM/ murein hydrolase activator NlpD